MVGCDLPMQMVVYAGLTTKGGAMSSVLFAKIRNLEVENDQLRRELAEWKEKAEALCHINTYTCERMNRMHIIKGGGDDGLQG